MEIHELQKIVHKNSAALKLFKVKVIAPLWVRELLLCFKAIDFINCGMKGNADLG